MLKFWKLFCLMLVIMFAALNSAQAQTMSSGWYWPTGSGNFGGYLGFLGYNSSIYPWHLAQDMKNGQGSPVYSIGDGEVILSSTSVGGYGPGYGAGGAVVIRHTASDGTVFTALYGHMDKPHGLGHVSAGNIVGYCNAFEPPHVHFGINLNTNGALAILGVGIPATKATHTALSTQFHF